jgi:ribonuclease Y
MEFSVLSVVIGMALGAALFFAYKKMVETAQKKSAQVEADKIINRAKSESQKIMKSAERKGKDFEVRAKKNAEKEIRQQKEEVAKEEAKYKDRQKHLEKEYRKKEERLLQTEMQLKKREETVKAHESRMEELEREAKAKIHELSDKLKNSANISPEDAKEELKRSLEDEVRAEAAKTIISIEEDAKQRAEQKAKRIIGMAISRYAGEFTTEKTVSVIPLPNEELKGKIIGREGRNIRAIESLCGVDLIIDETPEAVVISGFDPVRREVAKRSLETLMEDGRIHPGAY